VLQSKASSSCPHSRGWREQCPSVIIFKLVPEIDAVSKEDVEDCYSLILEVMRRLARRLIYCKEISGQI
jgi:hypothetical protein